jgi:hypothetical protein
MQKLLMKVMVAGIAVSMTQIAAAGEMYLQRTMEAISVSGAQNAASTSVKDNVCIKRTITKTPAIPSLANYTAVSETAKTVVGVTEYKLMVSFDTMMNEMTTLLDKGVLTAADQKIIVKDMAVLTRDLQQLFTIWEGKTTESAKRYIALLSKAGDLVGRTSVGGDLNRAGASLKTYLITLSAQVPPLSEVGVVDEVAQGKAIASMSTQIMRIVADKRVTTAEKKSVAAMLTSIGKRYNDVLNLRADSQVYDDLHATNPLSDKLYKAAAQLLKAKTSSQTKAAIKTITSLLTRVNAQF